MSIRTMMIGGAGARVPDAPTSVSATAANSGELSVSFTAPAVNGGSAITGYRVTVSPGGATFTGSSSPIVATGLTNGTTYTVTVAAQNAIGYGAESSGVTGTPQDPPLFSFTTATFTNGGAVGRDGPGTSAAQGGMSGTPTPSDWNTNGSYFTTSSGIQLFTVPKNGTYEIQARGASGSGGGPNGGGGQGAVISTRLSLTKSAQLGIVVGQMGQNEQSTGANGGGGGGSFVYNYGDNTLYVAAGGGGGVGNQSVTSTNNASTSTSGQPGSNSSSADGDGQSGGSSGNAGTFGDYSYTAGPGAGWFTGGNQNRPTEPCSYPAPVQRGAGRSGGFRGGAGYNANPSNLWGGFGGGGGGSGACNESGSGGGGGYSGGGVGNSCCASKGGGGGSYYTGSLQSSGLSGSSTVHGQVIITFIS
jgi:hypothetical protein